ncbi:hypothetical protein [Pararhizobium gei]|uniref:hypothetical protein n=1 Tax=Pararhizobium gei TaxID=1395951 RepID=UPI0023DC157F|nr:hypothetical protein [Rhizobium gei]
MKTGSYGPIEVFRAGTFSPVEGQTTTITELELQKIASSYDPETAPAPIVIGHPAMDAPAYGWVERLYVEGGKLKAMLKDTVAEFADMVKAKRYTRVSMSLFLPNSPANPKPGEMYIKHIGFLGAAAPAVAGLKPVEFSGGVEGTVSFAQDVLDFAFVQDENKALKQRLNALELEGLINDGRVLPVFKSEILSFAASLDESETLSFADGRPETRRGWFLSYLARQPKVVSFGAMNIGDGPLAGDLPVAKIAVPEGYEVDEGKSELYRRARELEARENISFAAALDMAGRDPGQRTDVNRTSSARKF